MISFDVQLENKKTHIAIGRRADFSGFEPAPGNSLLVTDETMIKSAAAQAFVSAGINSVVLGPGERYKSLSSIETIAEAAVRTGLDRGAVIIGLGGGVICDMTAFAASVYMRGCRLALAPTTLLSMVDASIGGKTGVDFLDKKNLIGSFYPAENVFIYTEFLQTLSGSEYKSGLAEIIKHGFLSGDNLLGYIEEHAEDISSRDPEIMQELIFRSLKVKAEYIEQDFREQGIRAHLNLGHTFGHALETAAGLGSFTHGEAVAWGISRAARAGALMGITSEAYVSRVDNILRKYGYNIDFSDFNHTIFMDALFSDKKKKNGELRFILQKNIGETVMESIGADIIKEVIQA